MFTCLKDRMLPTYFDDHMPTSLYPFYRICLDTLMITCCCVEIILFTCSHALIFTCLILKHKCTHLDDEMFIGSKAKVIMKKDVCALKCVKDCA